MFPDITAGGKNQWLPVPHEYPGGRDVRVNTPANRHGFVISLQQQRAPVLVNHDAGRMLEHLHGGVDLPLVGVLPVSGPGKWKIYSSMKVFKHPPSIVIDENRRALLLKTDHETMAIGRSIHADIATTRILVWDWKPLVLPAGGDVREHAAKRNDQVARVVVWFDASLFDARRAIAYIWDSSAPAGTIIRDRGPHAERVLVVVRSGSSGLGAWHHETRNVYQDYRDIFRDEPTQLLAITLESHSDDVASQSEVLFGRVQFRAR